LATDKSLSREKEKVTNKYIQQLHPILVLRFEKNLAMKMTHFFLKKKKQLGVAL